MDLSSWDIKQLEPFLPLIFPLLVFGAVFFFFTIDSRKKKEVLGRLALRFQGEVGGFFHQSFRGAYEGIPFSLTLIPAGKNTPPYLVIELFKSLPFTLQVQKEGVLTGIGKNLGFVKEVAVPDPAFDDQFFVRSDKPGPAASYLERPEVRQAIVAVFAQGFDALVIGKRCLYVRKPDYAFPADLEADRVAEILRTLVSFPTVL